MDNTVVMIEVSKIKPHPCNPRKDLGDISELAESIKTNGLLQNLVVMEKENEYMLLIGHRRLAAAKMAGLDLVPCFIINDVSDSDQVAIMLEENMHRDDLTIWEQSQGFQLMLDLGDTEEDIANRTGFSKTTIKRRVNIAKLDQETLKAKEEDTSFQLSLTDLYLLENIDTIEERNEILASARNSSDIAWRVERSNGDKQRKRVIDECVKILDSKGVKPAPENVDAWTYGWELVRNYLLDNDKVKESDQLTSDMFYKVSGHTLNILRKKATDTRMESMPRPVVDERAANKEKLKAIVKEFKAEIKDCVKAIVTGRIKAEKITDEMRDKTWQMTLENGFFSGISNIAELAFGCNYINMSEPDKMNTRMEVFAIDRTLQQIVLIWYSKISGLEMVDYNGMYKPADARLLNAFIYLLNDYGYKVTDEDFAQVLDGTHDLYA